MFERPTCSTQKWTLLDSILTNSKDEVQKLSCERKLRKRRVTSIPSQLTQTFTGEITKRQYGELAAPKSTVGYRRNIPQVKAISEETWTS
jgi:hypothetical protein